MTDNNASILNASNDRGDLLYAEQGSLNKLAALTRVNPNAATLMLILMANMDEKGALVISYSTLVERCQCSLATVKQAIADLAKGNWILSVDTSPERGDTFACVVNSFVARVDKPDESR